MKKMFQLKGESVNMGHSWIESKEKVLAMACAVAVGCWLSGCTGVGNGEDGIVVSEDDGKVVTIGVASGFAVCVEDMGSGGVSGTRATLAEAGMTDLWVLDYVNGELKQSVKQSSGDEGFGSVLMKMAYGQHKIVAVAGRGDGGVLTDGDEGVKVVRWNKVKDTAAKAVDVEVTAGLDDNIEVQMVRVAGAVKVVMKDAVPAEAKRIEVEMRRCQEVVLPELEAGSVAVGSVESEVPGSWAGGTNKSMTVYSICGDEGIVTDVNVRVKDADGVVIASAEVKDVSVEKNKMVTLIGNMFQGKGRQMVMSVDDVWSDGGLMEY